MQDLPGDLASFRQVNDRAGDVVDRGKGAHRRQRFEEFSRILSVKRRVDDSGGHGIESNALLRIFGSQAPQCRFQPTLGDHGNGSGNSRNRIVDQRRGDADDAAARLLLLHLSDGKLRNIDEAREVGRHQSAKIFGRVVGEALRREDASIGDYGVDRAEVVQRSLYDVVRGFELADVAVDQGQVCGSGDLLRFRRAPRGSYNVV